MGCCWKSVLHEVHELARKLEDSTSSSHRIDSKTSKTLTASQRFSRRDLQRVSDRNLTRNQTQERERASTLASERGRASPLAWDRGRASTAVAQAPDTCIAQVSEDLEMPQLTMNPAVLIQTSSGSGSPTVVMSVSPRMH